MLKLFTSRRSSSAGSVRPSIGGFGRVYAVGDVHGRFDLFVGMLRAIARDLEDWENKPFQIIFLGDLIDRGGRAKEVVELACQLARATNKVRFLQGNHEEVFLRVLEGDSNACEFFYRIGGRETLMSYGLEGELDEDFTGHDVVRWMQNNIPTSHAAFLLTFENMIILNDYIFVHAGIRPKVPLEKQVGSDLRWIREKFLDFTGPHPGMVIHGHSISEEVDEQHNRIGVDTGAYRSGRLTAIVLEGQDRRFLTVEEGHSQDGDSDPPVAFFRDRPDGPPPGLQAADRVEL